LTLLRGYCAAHRPDQKLKPWGSYEAWSDIVRSAVVWAGLADPGATRKDLRDQADEEGGLPRAILAGIWHMDPTAGGLTVADMTEKVRSASNSDSLNIFREAALPLCGLPANEPHFPSGKSFSHLLRRLEKRVFGRVRLVRVGMRDNTVTWAVRTVDNKVPTAHEIDFDHVLLPEKSNDIFESKTGLERGKRG
jgi:hypothetical protein